MSEKLPENAEAFQTRQPNEQLSVQLEREPTEAEKNHGSQELVVEKRQKVEQLASSKDALINHSEKQSPHHPVLINKHLKDMAYSRSMLRMRKKLHPLDRIASRITHAPVVDKSAELIGKTIARPSGMLSGSLFAFFGTVSLLYLTRQHGYRYSYLASILLFITGMTIGLLIEVSVHLIRSYRKN